MGYWKQNVTDITWKKPKEHRLFPEMPVILEIFLNAESYQ